MDFTQACYAMATGKKVARKGQNTYYCFDPETGQLQYGYIDFNEPARQYPSQKDFFADN